MELTVYNTTGNEVEKIILREDIFGVAPNESVVHQALVRQLANKRQGTADSKTRGQVSGSTRKLYRQKHTGRARHGGIKSPTMRGGGVTFGPHPRSYKKRMPKKMRQLALKSVLSAKAASGELMVIDKFNLDEPKTKKMAALLNTLNITCSALIAIPYTDINVVKSSRNLNGIKTIPTALLNVADLLSKKLLITTVEGIHKIEELWGQKEFTEVS